MPVPACAAACLRLGFALLCIAAVGCASISPPASAPRFEFFATPEPASDLWFAKVAEWQARASADTRAGTPPTLGPDSEGARATPEAAERSGLLRIKMGNFASDEKRKLARKVNAWSQREARRHYRIEDDRNPALDHWPTFDELIARNGDDCDGLDLIAYRLLLEFGFRRDRVYRAIVKRARDGGNHMVTLWFEDPEDPWILDATGAMTFRMRRFSEIEGWRPRKVFNETVQFATPLKGPGPAND
ncbi:MAG: hypothetical protein VCC02_00595 [Myxococcota bacterium]